MKDTSNTPKSVSRRSILAAGAVLPGAILAADSAFAAAPKSQARHWDMEADVVCVGSGAAAGAAAVTATSKGAKVIVLEKLPMTGGTTGKSGGVAWIPNNRFLRADGVNDSKQNAMRYMVRFSYPLRFAPDHPNLGVTEAEYKLIEAFYDNGSVAVEHLETSGALGFQPFRMFAVNRDAPDYADHVPENKTPHGRAIQPAANAGGDTGGGSLAAQMEAWLLAKGVPVLTDTKVTRLIKQDNRVIGVEALDGDGKLLSIKAHKGVIFGTGGYAHNKELINRHQTALFGSCARTGATGDFIAIAAEAGAAMGNLGSAWRSQVALEEALENRALARCCDYLPGDSMITVNKYGKRVGNEKRNYNDRTRMHFTYDPTKEEYPNHLLFMIFDHRSLDSFGGSYPFPLDKSEAPAIIEAPTLEALTEALATRLTNIAHATGGVRLDPAFKANMLAEVSNFNRYATAGRDPDFDRGLHDYDRNWHLLFSARREGTSYPANPYPNVTMHPMASKGPFYAIILAAGALDTNSGPLINEKAQVLDHQLRPIPGLYGAGNCIASPSRDAYYGAGCTIGLALTYGYIAAQHSLSDIKA